MSRLISLRQWSYNKNQLQQLNEYNFTWSYEVILRKVYLFIVKIFSDLSTLSTIF